MGVLNDFLGVLRDFQTTGDDVMGDTLNRKRYSSMSKRSLEGTMQFPTIVSRSIDIDTLQMTTKALEKQFASFAQVAITMSPFLDLNRDKDAAGFIRKFHQNSTKGSARDEFLNLLAYTDVKEAYSVFVDEEKDLVLLATIAEGTSPRVIKTNKDGLTVMMEGLRDDCLNDIFKPRNTLRTNDDYLRRKHTSVLEKSSGGGNVEGDMKFGNVDTVNQTINVKGGKMPGVGVGVDQKLPTRVLVDNDVKKSNELVPTTMHIRTILKTKDGVIQGNMDFVAGVKATMHPVDSAELITNIVDAIKNRGKLFKFIRWTTGEIQFARDYVLNLSEIKEDAARTRDKNSRWWTALKRRKKLAKFKRNLLFPGDILPNASIVLSMEEVEHIKQEFGYDLLDSRIADKIMREYFLIAIAVVDSGAQVTHFLFDGYEDYQTVTFSGLERGDMSGSGVDFKDVLKLVQRV